MAILYVNGGNNYIPTTSGTSIPASAINAIAGNFIVVILRNNGASSVTDTAGNTYVRATMVSATNVGVLDMWYAKNIIGNASNVVTANFSGPSGYLGISVSQYSGVDKNNPLDITSTKENVSGSSITSDAFTTNFSEELIIAGATTNNPAGYTSGVGYLLRDVSNITAIEDKIVTSIQTGVTASINSSGWFGMIVATFKGQSALVAPIVTTQAVSSISSISAVANGNILSTGNENPYQRGFAVAGAQNPTVNLITNGDFELWTAGTTSPPDGWSCPFGAGNVALRSTDKHGGLYAGQFTSAPSGDARPVRLNMSLVNGGKYYISAWIKKVSGVVSSVYIAATDTSSSNVVAINSTSYTFCQFILDYQGITTVAFGSTFLDIGGLGNNDVILIDDFFVASIDTTFLSLIEPSLEGGIPNWINGGNGGSFAQSGVIAKYGTKSIAVSNTPSNYWIGIHDTVIPAGKTITFGAWVNSAVAGGNSRICIFDNSIQYPSPSVPTDGLWYFVTTSRTLSTANPQLWLIGDGSGHTGYFDGLLVAISDVPVTFVFDDGSFPIGAYTKAISGLTPSTNYRTTAFTTNSLGIAYGITNLFTTLGNLYAQILNETVTITPTVVKSLIKFFNEVTLLTSTLLKQIQHIFIETISLTATMTALKIQVKTLLETISLIDNPIGKIIKKIFNETITLTSILVKISNRVFSEAVSLTANFFSLLLHYRILTETISYTDVLTRLEKRLFIEVTSIVDTYYNTKAVARFYSEAISLTDSFSRILTKRLTLVEVISLLDEFIIKLNGYVTNMWAKVERTIDTWSKIEHASDIWNKQNRDDTPWNKKPKD